MTLDLAAIQARERAATPGPWYLQPNHGDTFVAAEVNGYERGVGDLDFGAGDDAAADREFTLNARQDVPALLTEITRLREENARLTAELTVEYNPVAVPKTIIQLSQYVEPEWRQFYEDENGGTVTICSHPEDGTVRIFTSYRACRVPLGVVEALVAALREAAHRTTQPPAPTAALEG
jgi:hypothetical protein